MIGPKQEPQAALFYEFSLEEHVPQDHMIRKTPELHSDRCFLRSQHVVFHRIAPKQSFAAVEMH